MGQFFETSESHGDFIEKNKKIFLDNIIEGHVSPNFWFLYFFVWSGGWVQAQQQMYEQNRNSYRLMASLALIEMEIIYRGGELH